MQEIIMCATKDGVKQINALELVQAVLGLLFKSAEISADESAVSVALNVHNADFAEKLTGIFEDYFAKISAARGGTELLKTAESETEEENEKPAPCSMFVLTADKKIKRVDFMAVERTVIKAITKTLMEFLTKLNLVDKSLGVHVREFAEDLANYFFGVGDLLRKDLYEELKQESLVNLSHLEDDLGEELEDREIELKKRITEIKTKLNTDADCY